MFFGGLVVLLLGLLVLLVFGSLSFGSLFAGGLNFGDFQRLSENMSALPLLREAGFASLPLIAIWLAALFVSATLLAIPTQAGLNLVRTGSVSIGQAMGKSFGRWFALGLAFLLMQLGIAVLEIILVWVPSELNFMLGVIGSIVNTIVVIAISLALAPLLLVILDGSGAMDAFGRSLRLTQGHRLSILLFGLLAALAVFVVMLAAGIIGAIAFFLLDLFLPRAAAGTIVGIFGALFALCFYSVISIYFGLGASLVYTRLLTLDGSSDGGQPEAD
ncbi:MAG: hypothetical protein CBD00_02145 [Rhodospirillaceae bacterium TMED140]|nr:MAG: hypothetical protein CBD00_02145 [Rhodospirillaceae bacterium TMED140]